MTKQWKSFESRDVVKGRERNGKNIKMLESPEKKSELIDRNL
jgi:hypothetical protein